MALLKQSTAYTRLFKMIASADHLALKTAASPVVNISKAGAAFGAAAGAVSEVANGWYQVALTAADTGTLGDLALYITGTAADDTDFVDQVVAFDPTDAAALGLSRLDAAISSRMATFTLPTNFSSLSIDASGRAKSQAPVQKNIALTGFEFLMTDSTTHLPKTGLTVSVTRSIDGGAFGAGALSAVTEVGNGLYKVNFGAADLNGGTVILRATAAGADDTIVQLAPMP